MKVAAVVLAVIVGASTVAMPASVSAGSQKNWQRHRGHTEKRCSFYGERIDAHLGRFNQHKSHRIVQLQDWINRANDRGCAPSRNIVDTLVSSGSFTTLVTAVQAAGLVDTLRGGEFTIFAPTNQAFAELPAGTVEGLLADPEALKAVLTYHAVTGSVSAATAKTLTSTPTVNGQSITISKRHGSLYINESRVVLYDIKTTNGIIHVIDTVLIP